MTTAAKEPTPACSSPRRPTELTRSLCKPLRPEPSGATPCGFKSISGLMPTRTRRQPKNERAAGLVPAGDGGLVPARDGGPRRGQALPLVNEADDSGGGIAPD